MLSFIGTFSISFKLLSAFTLPLLSFIILFLFVFFYGLAFPLQELAFKLSSTKMSSEYGILYFWLISMFSITLFRQIKLKFRSLILNLILISLGILLIILFNNFIQNTSFRQLTVKSGLIIYERTTLTTGYITFRILQLFILMLVIVSGYNIFKIRKERTDFI